MKIRKLVKRGQTLVLFALTMLLLVVMVMMTLSFGTKAKEKMELQQIADQGAYSTAVATARGMNVLAMTNRVMLAHMVAMLGLISSSSFASMWMGVVDGMILYYIFEFANQARQCNPPWVICGCIGMPFVAIREFLAIIEFFRVFGILSSLDIPVAAAANRASLAVMFMYLSQVETHFNQVLDNAVDGQRMTRRVMQRSTTGPEWQVTGGASSVAEREVGRIPYVDGALNVSSLLASDRHAVMAAMGARGHPWTAGRSNLLPLSGASNILRTHARAVFGRDINLVLNDGNGYFGAPFHTNNMFVTRSTAAVADDHSQWGARYTGPGCPGQFSPVWAAAFVWSNAVPGYAIHMAGVGFGLPLPFAPVVVILPTYFDNFHPISGACILNCPSAWTNFVDYNLWKVMDDGDNFAQPKIPVTVTRNMSLRPGGPDPWNIGFNFRFAPTGGGANVDLKDRNGIFLRDGTDISRQTALSTGIVYYHREGHWKEPPNLFNPFWRGGLTRSDIDDQARSRNGDIRRVLNDSGIGWAADAYTQLYDVGFRGLQ